MMKSLLILLIVGLSLAQKQQQKPKAKQVHQAAKTPVIAILTIPLKNPYDNKGVVDEIYYEFLRQAGIYSIAIPYWAPKWYVAKKIRGANGLLLQGGTNTFSPDRYKDYPQFRIFYRTVNFALSLVVHLNQHGIFYPVFGICMGSHLISIKFAGTGDVITKVYHHDQTKKVIPTKHFDNSTMLRDFPQDLKDFMTKNQTSLYFNHLCGVTKDNYQKYLKKSMKVLAWTDHNGTRFIVWSKHRKYPIYAIQNHFEKAQFMMKYNNNVQHAIPNLKLGFYFALFILKQARKAGTFERLSQHQKYNLQYRQLKITDKHYDPFTFTYTFQPKSWRWWRKFRETHMEKGGKH